MSLDDVKLLRRSEVLQICGISKSTLYEMISQERFPAPVRISQRAVGWRAGDIRAWLESLPQASESNWR